MSFEQKYLKYKEKYLELKKQSGGVRPLSSGPMIGYPAAAVPIMGPSYRVRGPVVGPSPFGPMLAPMPGPFIVGPRLVRVSPEPEHTCPTCSTCPTCTTCPTCAVAPIRRINLIIRQATLIAALTSAAGVAPVINEDFTVELLNTTDNVYYNAVMGRLNALVPVAAVGAAAPAAPYQIRIILRNNAATTPNTIKIEISFAIINPELYIPKAIPVEKIITLTAVEHAAVLAAAPAGVAVAAAPPAGSIRHFDVNVEFQYL